MGTHLHTAIAFLALGTPSLALQGGAGEGLDQAASRIERRLAESLDELSELREEIAADQLPRSQRLHELESELLDLRVEFQEVSRTLDSRNLDLGNLRREIDERREESSYLANQMGEFIRNLEPMLQIAEKQRYEEALEHCRLAGEDADLSELEVAATQAVGLTLALDRFFEGLGGTRFLGKALDANGRMQSGSIAVVGPMALFRSDDGSVVGSVEERLGSLEPTIFPFQLPENAQAAAQLVASGSGDVPLDPTLGNARKIEAIDESFLEHVKKGGEVMVPIGVMAGAAFLVAVFKWIALVFVRTPSKKRVFALLQAVEQEDVDAARTKAAMLRGPAGRMLSAGAEHLGHPNELIEEVMYEHVLTARTRLQRFLPFIAICAAAAPLLGLLGTVTGIINTFKLITVFGSGDVKMLSGGISEALITTKFGLIVAIPSLLMHALLNRKARRLVGVMESLAVRFVNQVSKTGLQHRQNGAGVNGSEPVHVDRDQVEEQVRQILERMLGPVMPPTSGRAAPPPAGA